MQTVSRSLLQNNFGEQGASSIVEGAKGKPQLTLCGLKPDQAEANFVNRGLDVGDAILLAFDLKQNSVLAKLKCVLSAQHTPSAPGISSGINLPY